MSEESVSTSEESRYVTQILSSLITEKDSDNLPKDIAIVESSVNATWKDYKIHEIMPNLFKQQVGKLLKVFGHIFSKTNLNNTIKRY